MNKQEIKKKAQKKAYAILNIVEEDMDYYSGHDRKDVSKRLTKYFINSLSKNT